MSAPCWATLRCAVPELVDCVVVLMSSSAVVWARSMVGADVSWIWLGWPALARGCRAGATVRS